MTRPILWALGILTSVVVSTGQVTDKLRFLAPTASTRPQAAEASPLSPLDAALSRPDARGPRLLTLAADSRGHFSTFAIMDGVSVKVLVDTGATSVALPRSVALRMGLRVDERAFRRPASTANGVVMAAPVRISEVRLDSIVVRNVEALVLPDTALDTTLLGMSFLSKLDNVEMARGRLNLRG